MRVRGGGGERCGRGCTGGGRGVWGLDVGGMEGCGVRAARGRAPWTTGDGMERRRGSISTARAESKRAGERCWVLDLCLPVVDHVSCLFMPTCPYFVHVLMVVPHSHHTFVSAERVRTGAGRQGAEAPPPPSAAPGLLPLASDTASDLVGPAACWRPVPRPNVGQIRLARCSVGGLPLPCLRRAMMRPQVQIGGTSACRLRREGWTEMVTKARGGVRR